MWQPTHGDPDEDEGATDVELSGKIAVITGASSGIGEATARALASAGMTVVAVARRADRLAALAAEHPEVQPYAADVTDDDAVTALAQAVREEHGACHVLVNNAGLSGSRRFRGPQDRADLDAIMDVNFFGVVRVTAAFADLLAASAPSRLINVGSVAGKLGVGPPAYAASKFALVGFTEALHGDWRRRGVAVCQVNPGFIRTEGFPQDDLMSSPMARLVGTPDMVADAIVSVARSGARERTVPRWYRPLVTVRHTAAPAFWTAAKRL
jgi:NAD(P)-dependent dehydrogenase (short-subunit alcohol dehydrogenase family)